MPASLLCKRYEKGSLLRTDRKEPLLRFKATEPWRPWQIKWPFSGCDQREPVLKVRSKWRSSKHVWVGRAYQNDRRRLRVFEVAQKPRPANSGKFVHLEQPPRGQLGRDTEQHWRTSKLYQTGILRTIKFWQILSCNTQSWMSLGKRQIRSCTLHRPWSFANGWPFYPTAISGSNHQLKLVCFPGPFPILRKSADRLQS